MAEYKMSERKRAIKQIFTALIFLIIIIGGWRYPLLGYFIPICMLLGIGMALFKGRLWCDWLCPRGSFFDILIRPISPKKKIPKFLKSLYFRVGVLSFLMLMMAIQLIRRWPDPHRIGAFFVTLLTATTLLGIILALLLHQRTWCYICPIGTVANYVGRRRHLLRIDSELCTGCGLCYKVCPIQIAPHEFRKNGIEIVKDGDCLKCGLCTRACSQKALK